MLDRIIKLLLFCLGGLLIFLLGQFVASSGEEQPVPASTSRGEPPSAKVESTPNDLPTKRVKTIIVRPEDLSPTPQGP